MDHAFEPDPSRGVFSTMLVVDGRPVELDSHLARLRESARALYGIELPAHATELVADQAHGVELGRLRLECRAGARGAARLEALARPIERATVRPDEGLDLRAQPVDRRCGAHKWMDRRLFERLEAATAPADPLLVSRDGRALETTRANVFSLGEDGVLRTPPADGSILPGVTRAQAIAIACDLGVPVREEPVTIGALHAAAEVFATGSLRGVEPVRSLDGVTLGGRGAVGEAIAGALHRRWFDRAAAATRAGGG